MSNVIVDKQKIDLLANAIADKSGVPVTMTLDEMKEAVDGIGSPVIQSLAVTPSESQQTFNASGVDGYKPVTVNAISSNYVGSGITRRSSTDMTASGATVTAPAGYYSSAASKAVPNGSRGYGVYNLTKTSSHLQISLGYPNATSGYYASTDVSSPGTASLSLENKSVAPSTSQQVVTPTDNTCYLNSVTVSAMPSGTAGTPTATKGTVSNHSVTVTPSVTNSAGYITGGTKNGTAVSVSASELVSGTYTVSASGTHDVTNYASASVASGSASASATKGTVSNHSVTVTPSVTRTAGYVTAGTATGTGVSVSASELVSGNLAITQNGTGIDVTNYATVSVAVEGGGGGGGTQIGTKTTTHGTASASISFTGLSGEPTSFVVISNDDLATGASPYKTAAVVWDGSSLHGQTITNTNNAQVSYDGSGFSKSYSNGTLTITGTGTYFQNNEYTLVYSYGGTAASIDTADVQVGSGATSVTFTGLSDEPTAWSCIFKSNFSTSSGYQRVIAVVYDGNDTYGMEMDSSAHYSDTHWSYTYNNGSLTITSQGTNQGGYFHQPGYYQLTAVYGGEIEPTEIEVEPLSVTQNGTYTAPKGTAYSPVTVNVSGGSAPTVGTATITNSSNQNTSISFTSIPSRPIAFFVRCTGSLARSSNSSYYYVADIAMRKVSNVETVVGNSFRVSNGTYANVTSGYSFSYSGTTLTVSSSGARNSAPGSFYNSDYELTYVY